MNRKISAAILVLLLALSVLPLGALGQATTPFVEIQYPLDGQTVGEKTRLMVVAAGYDLRDPYVTITGSGGGAVRFPLEGCVFGTDPVPLPMPGSEDPSIYPMPPVPMKMYCNTVIDLEGFKGQKVELTVDVQEKNGVITDSVGLFVSGQCAKGGV